MRYLKCEFCNQNIQEINEEYLREYPIAANGWFEKLLTEHYEVCPILDDDEPRQAGMGSGYIS